MREPTPVFTLDSFRALELLNAIIDHMINDEGGHSRPVIQTLLELGFNEAELTLIFKFPCDDVKDVLKGMENGDDE